MNKTLLALFALPFVIFPAVASGESNNAEKNPNALTLWYAQPAAANKCMNETLPIGNGRLGAMIFGDPKSEHLVLNEDSLWTGDENVAGNRKPEQDNFHYTTMGAYQKLSDLYIDLPSHAGATDYRRELNISTAIATTTYKVGGTTYRREYFASRPANLIVVRFTADKPHAFTGKIRLVDGHGAKTWEPETTECVSGGHSFSYTNIFSDGKLKNGLEYETLVRAFCEGGKYAQGAFTDCDAVSFYIAAGTNYVMDYEKHYLDKNWSPSVKENLRLIEKKLDIKSLWNSMPRPDARLAKLVESTFDYDTLKSTHIKDYQSLFNRVSVDFGKTSADRMALPIDKRKVLLAERGGDPELEALMFQYARYLLISCSRPGGLPANLQGLWNDSNAPAWSCDYHTNINIQMNYWPAETTNLSECQQPLFDLIESQLPAWRKATQSDPLFQLPSGKRQGWTVRTSHNIMGGMGWQWDNTSNAWYAQHFWWHYEFTGDRDFLKRSAYPILKEVAEFWADRLKTLPDGRLVVPNCWSPEHGPREDGCSYSQQIVYDLFTNYIAASKTLDVDADFRQKIAGMQEKLVGPKIGRWGQLQEWMVDRDDPNDHHRHTSHLFGVYPGRQISVAKTPEFAAAAKKSLDARGPTGDVREWSFAWRTALYARLHDAESAHAMFQNLFADRNSCLNLFGLHPPMQIDGNFGITAGVAEMLLQSHEGEIALLPALPKEWPNGSVHGLRARGGVTVDMTWKDGRWATVTLRADRDGEYLVRLPGKALEKINLKAGQGVAMSPLTKLP